MGDGCGGVLKTCWFCGIRLSPEPDPQEAQRFLEWQEQEQRKRTEADERRIDANRAAFFRKYH